MLKALKFTKMHGAGNDFVVFDAINQSVFLSPQQIKFIANRHLGIGADQILLVEKPDAGSDQVDFKYRIFNADGEEAAHCGNGARCFFRFVSEQHLTQKNSIHVQIKGGIITITQDTHGAIAVDMVAPRWDLPETYFIATALRHRSMQQDTLWEFPVLSEHLWLSVIFLGNPHAVTLVESLDDFPVPTIGAAIESHPRFLQKINAGFMQIIDSHTVKVRVYERGSGETLACGTGACAAALIGIRQGKLHAPVTVLMRGGVLTVEWQPQTSLFRLSGPAVSVFQGAITL